MYSSTLPHNLWYPTMYPCALHHTLGTEVSCHVPCPIHLILSHRHPTGHPCTLPCAVHPCLCLMLSCSKHPCSLPRTHVLCYAPTHLPHVPMHPCLRCHALSFPMSTLSGRCSLWALAVPAWGSLTTSRAGVRAGRRRSLAGFPPRAGAASGRTLWLWRS